MARGQDLVEVKSMIDLVLVKKDMLLYAQVRLLGTWIKRREAVVGGRRIRSQILKEHQYREGYVRSLGGKGVEWDADKL